MAMALLPRFLVLKFGGKYLSVPKNLNDKNLKFDEEQIWSPRVKFAVERAETGNGLFVHIRSCYNNKYWVAHKIGEVLLIVAAGDKPEEDQSTDSCTLFQPFTSENGTVLCLHHVQNRMTLVNPGPSFPSLMFQGVEASISNSVVDTLFDIIDWETLVILPPRISFRSKELNGHYLWSQEDNQYPKFKPEFDAGDPLVAKVLLPTPDGNYHIMDAHSGKFWRCTPEWICADSDVADDNDNGTLFSIVKISDNVIALRNLRNNKFCGVKETSLYAAYDIMSKETRLMVEECVLQKEISDVRYRLSASRIYQEEIKEVEHAFATNNNPEHESKVTLNFKTFDSSSTHLTNSESIKSDLKVTVTGDFELPFISIGGEFKYSKETDNFNEWKESKKTERTREASYTVVVPPLKKIKVTLTCTKGNYDVPFSYIQRDLLPTGKRVTTHNDDGLFTGHNSYDFHFKSEVVTEDA